MELNPSKQQRENRLENGGSHESTDLPAQEQKIYHSRYWSPEREEKRGLKKIIEEYLKIFQIGNTFKKLSKHRTG